jgi:peroxiredoxin
MESTILKKGDQAPEFKLHVTPDQTVSLTDLKRQKVILVFYPADWSPVCGDQIALYNEMLKTFHKYNATMVGISVDSKWCHMAYSESRKLHFPLLSDFEPKGAVGRAYGVYDETSGEENRALFVIDEEGVIQ